MARTMRTYKYSRDLVEDVDCVACGASFGIGVGGGHSQ